MVNIYVSLKLISTSYYWFLKWDSINYFFFAEKTIYALQHEQEGTFEHSILIGATIGLYKAGYPIPKHIFQKEIVQKLLGLTF